MRTKPLRLRDERWVEEDCILDGEAEILECLKGC